MIRYSSDKDVNKLLAAAIRLGLGSCEIAGSGHWRFTPRDQKKNIITGSCSPSDVHAFNQVERDFSREFGSTWLLCIKDFKDEESPMTIHAKTTPEAIINFLSQDPTRSRSVDDIVMVVNSWRSMVGKKPIEKQNVSCELSRLYNMNRISRFGRGMYKAKVEPQQIASTPAVVITPAISIPGNHPVEAIAVDSSIDNDILALDNVLVAITTFEDIVKRNREDLVRAKLLKDAKALGEAKDLMNKLFGVFGDTK